MAVLPISIQVTETWLEITANIIPLDLIDEEVVEIYHDGAGLIEVIIDTLGTATIDSSFNGKGRIIEGSQFLTFPYLTTTRFYVRRIKYALKPASQIQIRKQVQNVNVGGVAITNESLPVVLRSSLGTENFVFPFGEQLSAMKHDDVLVQFQYNYLDYRFDVVPEIVTGDGVAGAAESTGYVSSPVAGSAILVSKNSVRYRPGHSGYIDFTFMARGDGIGKGGAFDILEQNGFQLVIDNGNASFGYLKSGVEKGSLGVDGFDDQSVWNGNLNPSDVDFAKENIFRIAYGFLGVANPTLWIKLGKWYHLHTIETEGVLEGVHVDTPIFPIGIKAENGMIVNSGSWNGGVIGNGSKVGTRPFMFPITTLIDGADRSPGSLTLDSTNVGTVVIFHSKDIFKGKVNNVQARLLGYDFSVDIPPGNVVGKVTFQIIGNPTLSAAATYQDTAESSVIEFDYDIANNGDRGGASVLASGGIPIIERTIEYVGTSRGGSTGTVNVNPEELGAIATRGNTFAIIAKDHDGNDVNVRVVTNREELF